jgi:hypothetical protein
MGLLLSATNANLLVNVHPGHIRLAVVLDHAQELPAVPLIEANMVYCLFLGIIYKTADYRSASSSCGTCHLWIYQKSNDDLCRKSCV